MRMHNITYLLSKTASPDHDNSFCLLCRLKRDKKRAALANTLLMGYALVLFFGLQTLSSVRLSNCKKLWALDYNVVNGT